MKKVIYLFLIILLLAVLDNTVITFLSIRYIYPSTLLVFVIAYAIINGPIEGIVVGIVAGAFQDLYFSSGMGINMLGNMIICLIAAEIGKSIFKDKSIVPIVSTFFLSFLKGLFVIGILFLLRIKTTGITIVLYKALYDMIVSVFLYRLVFKLSETKIIKKEWRF
ncbi:rod shape-determining protein MreD [Clostridium tunisiense]|uniref:rod shape-determining protein MreD n=1 Tax=Clostridium tunisiense TaxID=219748 RepID=UPI000318CDEF|nr:rod shape-determining protein MreD [Clostridium tunisiense]